MRKLLLAPLIIIAAVALSTSTLVATSSCSSPEQDSIKAAKAKADSIAELKKQLVPGFKLSSNPCVNNLDYSVIDVKGVCVPDRKVVYIVLDSICYETNIESVADSAWTNASSIDSISANISYGPNAAIVSVLEMPINDVEKQILAKYEADVEAATKAATSAAQASIAYENRREGDGQVRLGNVEAVDLQKGIFKYQAKYYYPAPRGWQFATARTHKVTVKRDGDNFTTK